MTSTARFDNWQNRLGTQAGSIDASGNVTFDNDVTVTGTITSVGNPQGLVLVKSQTIGSGVSSVTVSDAFSATFDNYFITMNGGSLSNDVDVFFRVGSATTGYYWALNWVNAFTGAGPTAGNGNNVGYFISGGGSTPHIRLNVMGPHLPISTEMDAVIRYSVVYGHTVGIQADATSHTSFTFYPYSGTMTGGTIRVYGYAQ
jgi:hypothetical protein